MPCRVTYYQSATGRMPVRDFLDELRDRKQLAAILADLSLLAEEGPVLPFPLTSSLTSFAGLRELRTRHAGAQFRTVYKIVRGDAILLHSFRKTATAQSRREYQIAAERARSVK